MLACFLDCPPARLDGRIRVSLVSLWLSSFIFPVAAVAFRRLRVVLLSSKYSSLQQTFSSVRLNVVASPPLVDVIVVAPAGGPAARRVVAEQADAALLPLLLLLPLQPHDRRDVS